LGRQNILEKISADKRKQEWIVFEDSPNKKRKIGRIRKKNESNVLVEHWENKENEERQEAIIKCEGCIMNKEKGYKECKLWQPKGKVLGVIPKNCVNREAKVIDFTLKSITGVVKQQESEISEWSFTGIKLIRSREVEIIEAQNFGEEIEEILKKEAQELALRRDRNIVFYINSSLRKEVDKGIIGIG